MWFGKWLLGKKIFSSLEVIYCKVVGWEIFVGIVFIWHKTVRCGPEWNQHIKRNRDKQN